MYAYITSFPISNSESENQKNSGDWHFENEDIWNFKSEGLTPLINFITNIVEDNKP